MTKTIYPASLLTDFYKTAHRVQYPKGTEKVYSTFTPRSNKHFPASDKVVVFGIQSFVKKYLINYFNEHFFKRDKNDIVAEYSRIIRHAIGVESPDTSHLESLHDLGYLPVELKALKEGSMVYMQVPVLTIENTAPEFFWLTNYLETIMSSEIWMPMTSATTAKVYRDILSRYAMETVGHVEDVDFQAHDFSMRSMSSFESAAASGAAHLTAFLGSDTIPAIHYLEEYYNANIEAEPVAVSIVATEHSTHCANTPSDNRDEYEYFKRLITEIYPSGMVSIVSDTYDFFKLVEETLPRLKKDILNRNGKVVIRPDSSDPVEILCGKYIEDVSEWATDLETAKEIMKNAAEDTVESETPHGEHGVGDVTREFKYDEKYYRIKVDFSWNRYDKQYYYIDEAEIVSFEEFSPNAEDLGLVESLYNLFGGTVNSLGYKELSSNIGAIYGDSMTHDRVEEICRRLKEKGFASTSVALGIGGYSYHYSTSRDSFGFAMKATYAVVNGEERLLFKDPKTDPGKRSQRGLVAVTEEDGELSYVDGLNKEEYNTKYSDIDQLEVVFKDGKLLRDESLSEIRKRLKQQ